VELQAVIFAVGKWRVELRFRKPLIDLYVQWPRQYGVWWEAAR
jgi:hypothetical protein